MAQRDQHKVPEPDLLSGHLIRRFGGTDGNVRPHVQGDCPDENLLAGFVAGGLAVADQQQVETHLAGCATCRTIVAAVAGDRDLQVAPVAAARRPRLAWPLLSAAALLLASLAGVFWWTRATGVLDPEAELVAVARALAEASPGVFTGFTPLTANERLAPRGGDVRGDRLRLMTPAGRITATRPAFAWEPVVGAVAYELTLRNGDGRLLFTRSSTAAALPFPDDQPELPADAAFHWQVKTEGIVRAPGERTFRTASGEERVRLAAAEAAIERTAPARARQLLRAHFCLRLMFYEQARTAAQAHVAANPTDRLGLETLFQVLVRLDDVSADEVRARLAALPSGG